MIVHLSASNTEYQVEA